MNEIFVEESRLLVLQIPNINKKLLIITSTTTTGKTNAQEWNNILNVSSFKWEVMFTTAQCTCFSMILSMFQCSMIFSMSLLFNDLVYISVVLLSDVVKDMICFLCFILCLSTFPDGSCSHTVSSLDELTRRKMFFDSTQ